MRYPHVQCILSFADVHFFHLSHANASGVRFLHTQASRPCVVRVFLSSEFAWRISRAPSARLQPPFGPVCAYSSSELPRHASGELLARSRPPSGLVRAISSRELLRQNSSELLARSQPPFGPVCAYSSSELPRQDSSELLARFRGPARPLFVRFPHLSRPAAPPVAPRTTMAPSPSDTACASSPANRHASTQPRQTGSIARSQKN